MSQKLARTALAVYLVDSTKYVGFHNALMDSRDPSDQFVQNTLKTLKIDHIKVKEAMKKVGVDKYISQVYIYEDAIEIRFSLKKDSGK
jgi:hypothetical protein